MLLYVVRCGAHPVRSQAGTAPDPEPQMGPATGSKSTGSTTPLVIAQWNAEGLQKKKPKLQNFLKSKKIDVICVQETHLMDAHIFFIRGCELFRKNRRNCHKGGLVTLVKSNIPVVQESQSEHEGTEHITVKIILPNSKITKVNCYCPPDKNLGLHHIPTSDIIKNCSY